MLPERVISHADFRRHAKRRLPHVLFDYVDGGAYDELTLERNRADLNHMLLRQRVLCDMSSVRMETRLAGVDATMPVVLAPVGFAGMLARRGEVQAARAAQAAGVPFTLSTVGICSAEEVTNAVAPPWMQLYMIRDRAFMRDLLQRTWALGSRQLVFTVDLPAPGARYRDVRSGMSAQQSWRGSLRRAIDGLAHSGWLLDVYLSGRPHSFGNLAAAGIDMSSFAAAWGWMRANFDASVSWPDLAFVRQNWPGAILLKGILDVEDARMAVDAGVDGIVVSNHGGRQLDGVRSSIEALPPIADAVDGRLDVLMDGGIVSGLDILKALANGARGCMLGRAWAFALAAGGEEGVSRMLSRIRDELRLAMIMTGCKDVRTAGRHLIDRKALAHAHS